MKIFKLVSTCKNKKNMSILQFFIENMNEETLVLGKQGLYSTFSPSFRVVRMDFWFKNDR